MVLPHSEGTLWACGRCSLGAQLKTQHNVKVCLDADRQDDAYRCDSSELGGRDRRVHPMCYGSGLVLYHTEHDSPTVMACFMPAASEYFLSSCSSISAPRQVLPAMPWSADAD